MMVPPESLTSSTITLPMIFSHMVIEAPTWSGER